MPFDRAARRWLADSTADSTALHRRPKRVRVRPGETLHFDGLPKPWIRPEEHATRLGNVCLQLNKKGEWQRLFYRNSPDTLRSKTPPARIRLRPAKSMLWVQTVVPPAIALKGNISWESKATMLLTAPSSNPSHQFFDALLPLFVGRPDPGVPPHGGGLFLIPFDDECRSWLCYVLSYMVSPNGSPPQLLRTTDGQCLCFRELIIPVYSQYRSVSPETTPQHVNYLRRVMTRQLPPPRRRAAWVYARDRCERRRWKDAAPFVEGLRRRGWAVVQPADLLASTPQELCRSFNEADLIVAPHGAHMAYTLCARRDTVVVEMACTQIRDWLASPGAGPYHTALGLRYQFWVGGPPHGSPACNVSKSFSLLTRGRSTLAVDSDFDAGSENLLTLVDKLSRPPPGPPESSPARLARESPAIVLVLIWTPPSKTVVRAVIRSTLPELTRGEPIEVRFALGNSPVPEVRAMLATEQARCDDLALLAFNETEDKGFARSSSVKLWHTYAWALERRPAAELIFKQDSDALVDWRRALRTMLASASLGGETVPFRHLFLGRICQPEQCPVMLRTHGACVAGMVLGLSRDVVGWILRAASPPVTTDDINVCTWAAEYDDHHPGALLNRHGITLAGRDVSRAPWLHPLKNPHAYLRCFLDREHGCSLRDPEQLHFQLPLRARWSPPPSVSTLL